MKATRTNIGIAVWAVVYVLFRLAPMIRPALVVVALLLALVDNGSRRNESDQELDNSGTTPLLVAVLVLLGIAPVLGWIHGASNLLDPFALIVGGFIAWQAVRLSTISRLSVELLPMFGVFAFALHWWRSFISDSSPTGAMARALAGWDHFGHFYLYIMNLRHDGFNLWLPTPSLGTTWYDMRYPSGIHMAWTQWWNVNTSTVVSHPTHALYPYLRANLVTFAFVGALIVLAVTRMGSTRISRLAAGVAGAGAVLGFMVWGPMAMTLWMGFPNFAVAIAGAVVVLSILLRPLNHDSLNLLLVTAAMCVSTYNWYPSAIAVSPVFAYFAVRWIKQRGWFSVSRWSSVGVAGLTIIAPAVATLAIPVKHIQVDGGIDRLPVHMVTLAIFGGITIGIWQWMSRPSARTAMVAVVFVILGVFQLVVSIAVRRNTGGYPYYVQKIGYVTVFVTYMGVVMITAQRMFGGVGQLTGRRARVTVAGRMLAGGAMLALVLTQVFGYVGPDWKTVAPSGTLAGATLRAHLNNQVDTLRQQATTLVAISDAVATRPFELRDCVAFLDPALDPPALQLANNWVGTLTWSLTERRIKRFTGDQLLIKSSADPANTPKYFHRYRKPDATCLVAPDAVARAVDKLDPDWPRELWSISPDGNITKVVH